MSRNFVVWDYQRIDGRVRVDELKNVKDDHELVFGRSRAADFPRDAQFLMDPDFPTNTVLTDSLYNTDSLIVASQRLVDFLASRRIPSVEYLPVTIIDHKKKPVKARYFIVNPVGLVDCVDAAASGGTPDLILPTTLMSIERLVLDESRIPADRQIFRTVQVNSPVIVRKALADAIDAAKFVGICWVDPLNYRRW